MNKKSRICIVDDDPICVFTTKIILEASKMFDEIQVFHSGKEAFETLSLKSDEELPSIIILDINMPIWDGWDFLDEIVKKPLAGETNIYVVSSSNDPEDILKAKSYPMVLDFVLKPIDIQKIIASHQQD
jgi:CheY-like chemotaxis protein